MPPSYTAIPTSQINPLFPNIICVFAFSPTDIYLNIEMCEDEVVVRSAVEGKKGSLCHPPIFFYFIYFFPDIAKVCFRNKYIFQHLRKFRGIKEILSFIAKWKMRI